MLPDKSLGLCEIPFTHLSKHPAHGFMHKVFLIIQKHLGNFKRIHEFVLANKIESRKDGNSASPKMARARHAVKTLMVFSKQPAAYNMWGGKIDEIPIIYKTNILQVFSENKPLY